MHRGIGLPESRLTDEERRKNGFFKLDDEFERFGSHDKLRVERETISRRTYASALICRGLETRQ